jgi:hypothetical protein
VVGIDTATVVAGVADIKVTRRRPMFHFPGYAMRGQDMMFARSDAAISVETSISSPFPAFAGGPVWDIVPEALFEGRSAGAERIAVLCPPRVMRSAPSARTVRLVAVRDGA